MDISPGRMVLMAVLPMPPSTNDLHNPVVRRKKARSVFEEDKVYAGKRLDPAVAFYELAVRSYLNYPQMPWRTWRDQEMTQLLRDDQSILLDFELYEYFTNDKSDADNRVKALQDILCRYLDIDDKRIINPSQHKRVHKEFRECVVAKLMIAKKPDIWQEQMELDELLDRLIQRDRNEEKIAENRIILN